MPITSLLPAVILWLITLLHWRKVRRGKKWTDDPYTLNNWLFGLLLSICLTFQINAFGHWFDTHTLPNLSWLAVYVTMSAAIYFVTYSVLLYNGRLLQKTRWLKLYMALTILALVLIYSQAIIRAPENRLRHIPGSAGEFTFMLVMYSYAVVVDLILVYAINQRYHAETAPLTRVRGILLFIGTILTLVFFLIKIILVFGFYIPAFRSEILILLALLLILTIPAPVALAFISNNFYLAIARPVACMRHGWALYSLRKLLKPITDVCPSISEPKPSLLEFIRNPEYYVYNTLIGILDGKVLLQGIAPQDHWPAEWDAKTIGKAKQIYKLLQSVEDHDCSFAEMVQAYRLAGKQLHNAEKLSRLEASPP